MKTIVIKHNLTPYITNWSYVSLNSELRTYLYGIRFWTNNNDIEKADFLFNLENTFNDIKDKINDNLK